LLVKPDLAVSTQWAYENLRLDEAAPHPDVDGLMTALHRQDLPALAALLGNDLETVTIAAHPIIGEIKRQMRDLGALNALMSGSGPTVFGLFADAELARAAHEKMSKYFPLSFLTEVV
jgi:4-diphosphocytidyl-2-C-methyl-D-erythritol kinase